MLVIVCLSVTAVYANERKGSGILEKLRECERLCDNMFEQCLTMHIDCPLVNQDDYSQSFQKCADAMETCKENCREAFTPK